MKRIIYFSVIVLITLLSCSEDDNSKREEMAEMPTMEEYFAKHEGEFTSSDRQFLLSHQIYIQKGIYVLLSDKEKSDLWKSKFKDASKNNYFTERQRNYLMDLAHNFSIELAKDESYQSKIDADLKRLGVSENTIYNLFHELNNIDVNGNLIEVPVMVNGKNPLPISSGNCTTRSGWCTCFSEYEVCLSGCIETYEGCGWGWQQSCNRYCGYAWD